MLTIIYILCHYKKNTNKNRHQNDIQLKHSNRQCNSSLNSVITMKYKDSVSIYLIRLYQG